MTREEHIAELVKNGMPVDLAPRACDAYVHLLESSDLLLNAALKEPGWIGYSFMQGFVAGSMASVHHN
jgi:hypothetical protein